MIESQEFYFDGFGWICKRCEARRREESKREVPSRLPRYYREGEAESKQTTLSAPVAQWADASRRQLVCPTCGISELIDQT